MTVDLGNLLAAVEPAFDFGNIIQGNRLAFEPGLDIQGLELFGGIELGVDRDLGFVFDLDVTGGLAGVVIGDFAFDLTEGNVIADELLGVDLDLDLFLKVAGTVDAVDFLEIDQLILQRVGVLLQLLSFSKSSRCAPV